MVYNHASVAQYGSLHLIPRKSRLTVRTIAPEQKRCQRIEQLARLDVDMARRRVERKDAERKAFTRRHLGKQIDNPLTYDLVINTDRTTVTDSAAVIVEALRRRVQTRGES